MKILNCVSKGPIPSTSLRLVSLRGAKRRSNLFFFFILLSFSLSPAFGAVPQVCHKDNCVSVEVVSKDEDMERGLMYRTGLDQDKGMIFVFPSDGKQQFWMKNMHFSLDMLWISSDDRIVYIATNVPACTTDTCPTYSPDKAARFVLELNSGYTTTHQWKLGDILDLKGVFEK